MALQFLYTFLITAGVLLLVYAVHEEGIKERPKSFKVLDCAFRVSLVGAFISAICAVWGL